MLENLTNEEICSATFERVCSPNVKDNTHLCLPCKMLGTQKSIVANKWGFTNLLNHLKSKANFVIVL